MDYKTIAAKMEIWAARLQGTHTLLSREIRAEADYLDRQRPSPTLAELLTAKEAREALWCLCCCNYCDCGSDVPECIDNQDITEGVEQTEPPTTAKLCHALHERARSAE